MVSRIPGAGNGYKREVFSLDLAARFNGRSRETVGNPHGRLVLRAALR
jgi:hypothetical protein